jgi:uncharacterized protein (TIGR02246 family)
MTEDERAIRALIEGWMAATKSGDVQTVLGLMTEDAVFMVPGGEPFGREAFAAASQGMQGARIDGNAEVVELQVIGEWAFARTRIAVAMTLPGKPPMRRSGYTLTVFRKEADGRWRLTRDANLLAEEKEPGAS